jgi:serine/threonine protein kinase
MASKQFSSVLKGTVVLDQYRLLRPLGRGGMGTVCEAEDTRSGLHVAIKVTPNLREARLAVAVRHPHVVRVDCVRVYSGGVFLIMEFVNGPSLQAILRDGPLSWRRATAMMIAACEGIMALHDHGIIHRDVKPANLLCGANDLVKLTDFGLACRVYRQVGCVKRTVWDRVPAAMPSPAQGCIAAEMPSPNGAFHAPYTSAIAGTPHYMSPEQCRADECDERTDIYSLGATYHALLTGRTPYADAAPMRVLFEHCSAPGPDLCLSRRQIPSTCAKIVMQAMAKKRADRFASARDMRNALRRTT